MDEELDIRHELTKSTIIIDGYKLKLSDLLAIDETNIMAEFAIQPSNYGYIAVKAAEAKSALAEAKTELEDVIAQLKIVARIKLKKRGDKDTIDAINTELHQFQEYLDAVNAELAAQRNFDILNALVKTLEQRANMLSSYGAFLRQEREQLAYMSQQSAKEKLSK
jgi:hypothetical protein